MRTLCRAAANSARALAAAACLIAVTAATAPAVVVDGVAAVVNGEVITLLELQKAGRAAVEERLRGAPAADQERLRREVLSVVLEQLVQNRIQEQRARQLGIQVEPGEIDAAIANVRAENGLSEDLLARLLRERGITQEDYRRDIAVQIRLSKLVQREIRAKIAATDAEVAAWFAEHRADWNRPEKIRIRHLLVPLPESPTADEVEAARAKAEALLARARGGTEFAALVREQTPGAAADVDPVSGEIARGELSPALEQAAFALADGEVGGPVRGPAGFHLVQVVEKIAAVEPTLEQVRASIEQKIVDRKTRERFDGWLKQLRADAIVEIRY
jgi:peptidyl-prolyl cis-trans isomerase SurA